jgi:hypothetical protein
MGDFPTLKNTVENRRRILILIAALFIFHAFGSEWLVKRQNITDPELRGQASIFFDSYQHILDLK